NSALCANASFGMIRIGVCHGRSAVKFALFFPSPLRKASFVLAEYLGNMLLVQYYVLNLVTFSFNEFCIKQGGVRIFFVREMTEPNKRALFNFRGFFVDGVGGA
ncbi:unnamed protein product, partial [Laminaria digitata]